MFIKLIKFIIDSCNNFNINIANNTDNLNFDNMFNTSPDLILDCHGNGNLVEIDKTVYNFTKVKTNNIINIEISEGDYSCILHGEENILKHVKIMQIDNTLVADIENNINIKATRPVTLYVKMPTLRKAKTTGTGDIYIKTLTKTNMLTLKTTGTGNLKVDVNVDTLNVKCTGVGGFENFKSIKCINIISSGASNNIVRCSENLFAKVSGVSIIYIDGSPKNLYPTIKDIGKIKHMDKSN